MTTDMGSLKDLESVRTELRRVRVRAERAAAEAERRRVEAARNHDLFARMVGPVQPLRDRNLVEHARDLPLPIPRQRELDEQAALAEALSDEVDVESLLLTDDGLSFRRPGVHEDVLQRLRRGHWSIQTQIDLHGMRRDEARESLATFVRQAHQLGQRCVRVVHGKGHGSPGRQPVLKSKVQRWLAQRQEVLAFAQAPAAQGGAGALLVLLTGRPRRRPAAITDGH